MRQTQTKSGGMVLLWGANDRSSQASAPDFIAVAICSRRRSLCILQRWDQQGMNQKFDGMRCVLDVFHLQALQQLLSGGQPAWRPDGRLR
jgi:hypothetical protein